MNIALLVLSIVLFILVLFLVREDKKNYDEKKKLQRELKDGIREVASLRFCYNNSIAENETFRKQLNENLEKRKESLRTWIIPEDQIENILYAMDQLKQTPSGYNHYYLWSEVRKIIPELKGLKNLDISYDGDKVVVLEKL
jgi:predicted AlkP superfamily phosphohydrolase/phosphomutase